MNTSDLRNAISVLRLLIVFGISFFLAYTSQVIANSEEFTPSAATAKQAAMEERSARRRTGEIIADGVPKIIVDAIAELSEEATYVGAKQENPPLWPLFRKMN